MYPKSMLAHGAAGCGILTLLLAAISGCGHTVAAGPRAEAGKVAVIRKGLGAVPSENGTGQHVASAAQATGWATLTGHFSIEGSVPPPARINADKDPGVCAKNPLFEESIHASPQGDLGGVIVYLRNEKPPVHPDYEKTAGDEVVIDNKNCRFEPHTLAMRTTQTLRITNSDPIGHNTKGDPLKNQAFNTIIPAGGASKQKLPTEETVPVKVGCNIHPWMGGWVVVRSNPYAVVSDDAGGFTIKDLPAGIDLEFQLWQEKAGFLAGVVCDGAKVDSKGRFKIKLEPDKTVDLKVSVPIAVLSK